MTTIEVNDTLKVEIVAGSDPHVTLERIGGGCIRIEPGELRGLVAALVEGACRLGDAQIEAKR